jgi:hypothetical protein
LAVKFFELIFKELNLLVTLNIINIDIVIKNKEDLVAIVKERIRISIKAFLSFIFSVIFLIGKMKITEYQTVCYLISIYLHLKTTLNSI